MCSSTYKGRNKSPNLIPVCSRMSSVFSGVNRAVELTDHQSTFLRNVPELAGGRWPVDPSDDPVVDLGFVVPIKGGNRPFSPQRHSKPQPLHYKCSALPIELYGRWTLPVSIRLPPPCKGGTLPIELKAP